MKLDLDTAIAFYVLACVAGIVAWMNPHSGWAIVPKILVIAFLALGALITLFGKAR